MNFREQYERETGKCHFDYPNITRTSCTWEYAQWLENKLAQKPEVSDEFKTGYETGWTDGWDECVSNMKLNK